MSIINFTHYQYLKKKMSYQKKQCILSKHPLLKGMHSYDAHNVLLSHMWNVGRFFMSLFSHLFPCGCFLTWLTHSIFTQQLFILHRTLL